MKVKKQAFTSPLRYPGGKFRARKILDEYIPEGTEKVLAPFFGGGSFELFLNNRGVGVVAYDNFWLLANFWEQLLASPAEIASMIRPHLGGVDKEVFKSYQQELKDYNHEETSNPPANELKDLAVKFFIVNRCSFSGATLSGGFSKSASETRFTESIVNKLETFDNPLLSVAHGDFEQTIKSHSTDPEIDLLFLDPPYMLEEQKNKLYGKNGDMHRGFDHETLKTSVEDTGKPFVLTYNNCDEVKDLWGDYTINEAQWSYGMNQSKKSSELIITNINK